MMIRNISIVAAILCGIISAVAQNAQPVIPLPFAPNGQFATLTATGSSANVALPAGASVNFQNTGTTAVSCTLGIGSGTTALVSENIIQSGSSLTFTVGSYTYGACIDQTGSASNLVVLAGGIGGGGGGSGGGGGGSGSGVSVTAGCATVINPSPGTGTFTVAVVFTTNFVTTGSVGLSGGTYTVQSSDCGKNLVLDTVVTAVTLPAETTAGFGGGWVAAIDNQSGNPVVLTGTIDTAVNPTIPAMAHLYFQGDGTNNKWRFILPAAITDAGGGTFYGGIYVPNGNTNISTGLLQFNSTGSIAFTGNPTATFAFPTATVNYTWPTTTSTLANLTTTDQVLVGGANVTSNSIGTVSSTTTIDCGKSPLQYLTNGGAFTLAAPSNDGSCIIQVLNNSSAGAITFSGFTVNATYGNSAALTTTNTNLFQISIVRINSVSSYSVVPLQ